MKKLIAIVFSVLLVIGHFSPSANAAMTVDASTKAEINQLYDDLLKSPTDRSLNLRYSTILAKTGDYEAAIAPLERILVSEPDNAWLMLQLGILYNALNSKIMARTYLERALSQPNIADGIAQKSQTILATL